MSQDDPSLDAAYALTTPQDNQRLYARWAETYDARFAQAMDYQMPRIIAQTYAAVGKGAAPLLDVGAGTGLGAQYLPAEVTLDGLDISPEMLAVAAGLGRYRALHQMDLTGPLALKDASYGAVISAGTFTHGHVGPDALDELLRIARPGAVFVLGINAAHFEAHGFAAKFATLEPDLREFTLQEVAIYGAGADPAHRGDLAKVAVFWKAG